MIKRAVYYTCGTCTGSKKTGKWSFIEILIDESGNISVSKKCGSKEGVTNNAVELISVYNAVVAGYKKNVKKMEIHTDSAYVSKALNYGWLEKWCENGWVLASGETVKNKAMWQEMHKLCYQKNIEVRTVKVKKQSGDILNEYVNALVC